MRIGACQIMISGIMALQDFEVVNSRGVHVSSKSERGPSLSLSTWFQDTKRSMLNAQCCILHRL